MRKILGLLLFSLLTSSLAFAGQTTEISSTKSITSQKSDDHSNTMHNAHYVIDCDGWGFFSDRPGNHKPYENDSDYYTTICAKQGSKGVTVTFQQFAIEKFDLLTIWDESRDEPVTDDDAPDADDALGSYKGYASPGTITSKKGCLTFRFQSDATVVETGWYAKIGCANKPTTDPCKDFDKHVDSELKCGVMIKDDNYRGKNVYELYGDCTMPAWPSKGRELIYKFVNYKTSDLTFTLQEQNGNQSKVLNMFILNDCDPDACIGSVNRPARNGQQNRETVYIPNAPAGTYYVVVDGNQTYAHNWFKLLVECAGGDYSTCSDPYYYDDFDPHADHMRGKVGHGPYVDYLNGDYITKVNPFWDKSDNVGIRDARISNDRSSNGTQSLEFDRGHEGTQSVYLDLGRKFKGVYRICWNMYIESHSTAFFGLFGGDNSDPWGTINKEFGHNNGYEGRWFDVELFVDLDKNKYTLYMDNRCKVYSGDYYLNLDKLMFYSPPKGHFYVDHICYGPVRRIPAVGSLTKISALEDTPLFDQDRQLQMIGSVPSIAGESTDFAQLAVTPLNADDLKVMPNPTRGLTTIALDLAQEQNIQLQIFSPAGQIVRHIPLGMTQTVRQEVNLSDLANGLYILRATGDQSVITKKIILQQ